VAAPVSRLHLCTLDLRLLGLLKMILPQLPPDTRSNNLSLQ
jgi:hypothetical protein